MFVVCGALCGFVPTWSLERVRVRVTRRVRVLRVVSCELMLS